MLKMEEFLVIRDLYNQGLDITQIAKRTGYDRKTVRKYLSPKTCRELTLAHSNQVNSILIESISRTVSEIIL